VIPITTGVSENPSSTDRPSSVVDIHRRGSGPLRRPSSATLGTFFFCVRGATTGRQNLADRRYCIGRGLAAIRGNAAQSSTDFLRHLLGSISDAILREAEGAGSTFPNVNHDRLSAWPILAPPLPEQRKIAEILSSVDETIEKTEDVIAQLDVVKKAMLEELLTRGIPGRHSRFKMTEIGEVPAEWDVAPLGSLLRACDSVFDLDDSRLPLVAMRMGTRMVRSRGGPEVRSSRNGRPDAAHPQ
jgi:hypothetical protein